MPLAPSLLARLYDRAQAARWGLGREGFDRAVASSVASANVPPAEVERFTAALHLEDLALAAACAAGLEPAWDHFIREHRPVLYRAADAIDPSGRARELADALYADLFGLKQQGGERQSLFRYFHGRSRLTTWLRAVLAQRHVDALRAGRRLETLPDDAEDAPASPIETVDPDRRRWVAAMQKALSEAVSALESRDRLRLSCYYAQGLTLAEIGRLLREHEATVSRHLARTRRLIRDAVEQVLRARHGLDDAAIRECFSSVAENAGTIDLADALPVGKIRSGERSK